MENGRRIDSKSNPIIVFDTAESDGKSNITIGCRQPSFLRLQGSLIPKGFDSLDDFRISHNCVRLNSVLDVSATKKNLQELLAKRNEQKWKEMGYDQMQIENSLNRQHSHTLFKNKDIQSNLKDAKVFSSFSQLESFTLDTKESDNLPLMDIIEETEVDQKRTILRSLSSGIELPNLDIPDVKNQKAIPEEEEESDSSSDGNTICFLENGMPEHIYRILKHDPNTLVYKALCGREFPNLPYDIMKILVDELNYYITECLEDCYEAEAYHIQSIIDLLRKSSDKTILPPIGINQNMYHKKMKEFYNAFENKIEYWDTQCFLNEDNKERTMKKLNHSTKILPQSKQFQDELQLIQFQYEKTLFAINKGYSENLQRLKDCITKVQDGYNQVSMDPVVPHLSSRIMSRKPKIVACSKFNKPCICMHQHPKIIRPQTPPFTNKSMRS